MKTFVSVFFKIILMGSLFQLNKALAQNIGMSSCAHVFFGEQEQPIKKEISIHQAIRSLNATEVKNILDKGGNPNAQDENGIAPLHIAAGGGHPITVKVLIKAKANLNIKDNTDMTPLHYAAIEGI